MKSFASSVLALLTLSASFAVATPLEAEGMGAPLARRAVVNHDSLFPLPEKVEAGANGEAVKKFNPKIRIAHGCEPYPAVADNGDISGGVKPGGGASANCGDPSRGQTYARAADVDGRFAIMYSWFMPKDQPRAGDTIGAHRYDWENVVLILDAAKTKVVTGCGSGHGKYKIKTDVPTPPTVEYFTKFPTNHELQFSGDVTATTKPVVDWVSLSEAARKALGSADFGKASVPFKDGSFESNVKKCA